jgi:hypothetical protein
MDNFLNNLNNLNINLETDERDERELVEEIVEIEKTIFKRLKKGLESKTGDEFPACVMYLHYVDSSIDNEHLVECVCGKQHLKYLNHFSYYNPNNDNSLPEIIIGSKCIETIMRSKYVSKDIIDYLDNILDRIKSWKTHTFKVLNNERCNRYREYDIRPNYEYKNPNRKHFCRKCIIDKTQIQCIDCDKIIPIQISKGSWSKYKLRCKRCWYVKFIKK